MMAEPHYDKPVQVCMKFGSYEAEVELKPATGDDEDCCDEQADITGKDVIIAFDNIKRFFTADEIPAPIMEGCVCLVNYVNIQ